MRVLERKRELIVVKPREAETEKSSYNREGAKGRLYVRLTKERKT